MACKNKKKHNTVKVRLAACENIFYTVIMQRPKPVNIVYKKILQYLKSSLHPRP